MLFPLYLCIYERNNNIIFTKSYHVLYGNIFDNSATVYSLGAHLYRCTCWRHRPWYLWYGGRVYLGFHLRTEAWEPAYRRDVDYRLGHHCGSFPAGGWRIRLSCRACCKVSAQASRTHYLLWPTCYVAFLPHCWYGPHIVFTASDYLRDSHQFEDTPRTTVECGCDSSFIGHHGQSCFSSYGRHYLCRSAWWKGN